MNGILFLWLATWVGVIIGGIIALVRRFTNREKSAKDEEKER